MSVVAFVEGDLFTVRVVKSLSTNPLLEWANAYEFKSNTAGDEGALLNLADDLVKFEKAMHKGNVAFRRILVSTWEPDSKPYNPEAFFSSSLSGTGALASTAAILALTQCLSIVRQPFAGKAGHVFFRGALDES